MPAVVLLVLLIASVNLGIGYAIAMQMGYAPPGLFEAWQALNVDFSAGCGAESTGPPDQVPSGVSTAGELPMAPQPADVHPADQAKQPADEAHQTAGAPQPGPTASEAGALDHLELLRELLTAELRHEADAADIADSLRALDEDCEAPTVQALIDRLSQNCEAYLVDHETSAASLRLLLEQSDDESSAAVASALRSHLEAVEALTEYLRRVAPTNQPAEVAKELAVEIDELCDEGGRLRCDLEAAEKQWEQLRA